ncbi:MAG: TonB-dependent receptor [Flavobacteriales bacterium]|nr:TonB-dependent receptor [Flavobacteriales bacterium]
MRLLSVFRDSLRCFTLSLCLLAVAVTVKADDGVANHEVKGRIVDQAGHPVAYASVALYLPSDSSLVTGAASNDLGEFSIRAAEGRYYLMVRFLSYKDRFISDIQVNKNVDLGDIKIESSFTDLEAVTIEADKPQMELKLDKRVFNVGQDLNNRGATAAEVLDNIPSVEVDVEGNVSLRGSENVRILIDGKPSGLTGLSSTDALRMLQGDLVERVEVITNPSARYDAEGEVGIINIVLKKEKTQGFNGSIEARVGYPANYGLSATLNVRRKKFNYFLTYGVGYQDRQGGGEMNQHFFYPDTTYYYDRIQDRNRTSLSHNIRLGTDFYLTKKSSLTLSGGFNPSQGRNISRNTYQDFDSLRTRTGTVWREEDENATDQNAELNLNFRKTFEKEEQLWTIDLKWENNGEEELADLTEKSSEAGVEDIYQRTSQVNDQTTWLFQSDYIYPLGKDGKFEAGVKINLKDVTYDYSLEDQLSDQTWVVNSEFNNTLTYTDNVYAAYVMAGKKKNKFSYQAGLRFEQAELNTVYAQNNYANKRVFPSFFPSAHFSYEFTEDRSIQLSYSRRVSRPRHWWLIPFFGLADSRNIFSGNPNINPEFTHSMELGWLSQGDKGSILSSVYYRHTDGEIERVVVNDSIGVTRMFPINLGYENAFGLEFTISYKPMKNWNMNGSFNFYRAISDGTYEDVRYYNDAYAWSSRFSSKWKVKKKLNIQTSFNYRSPSTTAQGKRLAMYNWDASAALDILKGNGTLTLGLRDILNTRRRRFESHGDYFSSYTDFQWQSRTTTLTFSYRLNQKKKEDRGRNGSEGGDFDGGGDM